MVKRDPECDGKVAMYAFDETVEWQADKCWCYKNLPCCNDCLRRNENYISIFSLP
jgi:hypothetical protein